MSGAELVGLISGIITLVDASLRVYEAAHGAGDLPTSFRDVAARLPLIRDTLITAQNGLAVDYSQQKQHHQNPESELALRTVLEACADKARALDEIFAAVLIPPGGASRAERYRRALRMLPRGGKVEGLATGMLADLQVLTGNHAVKAATREQIDMLIRAALADERGYAPPVPVVVSSSKSGGGVTMNFRNTGTGYQIVHSTAGDQNFNTGSGSQFNGVFNGSFHFTPSR